MRELHHIAEVVELATAKGVRTSALSSSPLENLLKNPSLPPSVLCYLEASSLRITEHGHILEVPSQFHFMALKKIEGQLKGILGVAEFQIEVKKVDPATFQKPAAPQVNFRPRPVETPIGQVRLQLPPRTSEQSNLDLEKSRRLAVPTMNLSPNFQTPYELAKRWADSVNRVGNQILWVYGKSGSGKTHILKQLHEWVSLRKKLVHVDAMTFFSEWRRALESKDTMGFVRKYRRETDLLILENIESLENKHKTQEEVLITVNALMERGASIAVSSARSPGLLREVFEPALFSRLFGGMLIEVPTPDRGFKESLWRQLIEQHGLKDWPVDAVVVERIFNIPADSARGVHSLFVNAIANLSLKGSLTLKEVSELEGRFSPQEGPRLGIQSSPAEFVDKISRLCGVGMSAIQGNGRRSEISLARKFVCLALSRILGMTNSSIATYVNKDASTVSKALQAIEQEIINDRHVSGQWGYICQQLGLTPSFDKESAH